MYQRWSRSWCRQSPAGLPRSSRHHPRSSPCPCRTRRPHPARKGAPRYLQTRFSTLPGTFRSL